MRAKNRERDRERDREKNRDRDRKKKQREIERNPSVCSGSAAPLLANQQGAKKLQ